MSSTDSRLKESFARDRDRVRNKTELITPISRYQGNRCGSKMTKREITNSSCFQTHPIAFPTFDSLPRIFMKIRRKVGLFYLYFCGSDKPSFSGKPQRHGR